MKLEQIEITIGPDGRIQLETSGFSGDDCLEATKALEQLLGGQVISRERTSGAFLPVSEKTAEKVKIRR